MTGLQATERSWGSSTSSSSDGTLNRLEASTVLELDDVGFEYADGRDVIHNASFRVGRGEIVGIVGPSGCGKSTLLSLIAGLNSPTRGDVRRADSERHPLSMVFQKDTLLPWLRARDNVLFHERFPRRGARRASRRESESRARELLDLTGLADRADAYPYELSGGMRRRLAFLQAIAVEPEMLLLDEPFSSVDEPTRIGIHQDVFRIAKSRSMTTILVTHDLAEALTLCDRILILSRRPSAVAHEHVVTFGADRDMTLIRESAEYQRFYAQLWHDLSAEIRAGQP